MYIPLQLRLTLFFTLVLALACLIFGQTVYNQARQRAYSDLDSTLSSRAASVQLGKSLYCSNQFSTSLPCTLPSVDSLGTGGVAIEILDDRMNLIASTQAPDNFAQPGVSGLGSSPVPWDSSAAREVLRRYNSTRATAGLYSTISYGGQRVRVYTLININFSSPHIIQTARSEQDIEQSLGALQSLLLREGALVIIFALAGGWFITWGVLSAVKRMSRTAQSISTSRDFSQRVPDKSWLGRDELAALAETFNEMLASLEELYRQQQRFVADASHELRAPITSIRCNLDLLAKAPDLPPAEAQAALADAQAEADRMGRLVSDLLTLARSDSTSQASDSRASGYKKESEQKQSVDLDSLLLAVFRQYQPAGENGKSETREQGPRLLLQHITPAKVYGDADQLKQVLVALLDNALKYTPYEGTVSLALTTDANQAIIKVSDSGIGISLGDLPHIFERFYRADRARSRERGGSGLGLAIAQSIVQEHGGTIEVASTPGKGSTFVVKLPAYCIP